MNYLDVYFSRLNYFGDTKAERIKNSGIVAFEKWLAQSPFTVTDLSVERGLYFSGIIQTNKDKEESKIMYLYVANDIPIVVGDILTWRQDNGAIEKWLLLQKEHKVHETYQTFQIIKCNYELKWIDEDGYLLKSWAYTVSSVDNMVKGNFRMWHSLISPQPNKFAEIIMPRPIIKKETADYNQLMRGITFIIENEGWVVIECDWTSVEGIVYMSLTESKVNYQYDNRDIDVADTDRYKFPSLPSIFKIGEVIIPQFEADTLNQWDIQMKSSDNSIVCGDDLNKEWFSELHAIAAGQCIITLALKSNPTVTKDIEVMIYPEASEFIATIHGLDELRLDRQAQYVLINEDTGEPVIINDNNEPLVYIATNNDEKEQVPLVVVKPAYDKENNRIKSACVLHANSKNKLGEITLSVVYNEKTYTKTIKVIPLW